MRAPIIDTTRSVTIESDTVEIDGIDREIWAIVTRCPVNGMYVDYFASREEAQAELDAMFA
jgi:hypothetical protein